MWEPVPPRTGPQTVVATASGGGIQQVTVGAHARAPHPLSAGWTAQRRKVLAVQCPHPHPAAACASQQQTPNRSALGTLNVTALELGHPVAWCAGLRNHGHEPASCVRDPCSALQPLTACGIHQRRAGPCGRSRGSGRSARGDSSGAPGGPTLQQPLRHPEPGPAVVRTKGRSGGRRMGATLGGPWGHCAAAGQQMVCSVTWARWELGLAP